MKLIAFTGVPNTGKTTIISELEKIFSRNWYQVKVYDELSSRIYGLMPNRYNNFQDYTYYQEALYHLECARLLEILKDKKERKYDYIFIDRTWYDQHIFSEWLLSINKCRYIDKRDLWIDTDLYHHVVLFKNPITIDSPFYCNDTFITKFNVSIKSRYGGLVQEYNNAMWFLQQWWYKNILRSIDNWF